MILLFPLFLTLMNLFRINLGFLTTKNVLSCLSLTFIIFLPFANRLLLTFTLLFIIRKLYLLAFFPLHFLFFFFLYLNWSDALKHSSIYRTSYFSTVSAYFFFFYIFGMS